MRAAQRMATTESSTSRASTSRSNGSSLGPGGALPACRGPPSPTALLGRLASVTLSGSAHQFAPMLAHAVPAAHPEPQFLEHARRRPRVDEGRRARPARRRPQQRAARRRRSRCSRRRPRRSRPPGRLAGTRRPPARRPGGAPARTAPSARPRGGACPVAGSMARPISVFTSVSALAPAAEALRRRSATRSVTLGLSLAQTGKPRRRQRPRLSGPSAAAGPLGRVGEHPLAVLDVRAADVGLHGDDRRAPSGRAAPARAAASCRPTSANSADAAAPDAHDDPRPGLGERRQVLARPRPSSPGFCSPTLLSIPPADRQQAWRRVAAPRLGGQRLDDDRAKQPTGRSRPPARRRGRRCPRRS